MKTVFFLLFTLLVSSSLYAQFPEVGHEPDSIIVTPFDTLRSSIPHYHSATDMIVPYRVGSKWGISDTLGNRIMAVPAIYDEIDYTSESFVSSGFAEDCHCIQPRENRYRGCLITIKDGKYGAVGKTGVILQPKYERLTFSSEFFILEHRDDKPGRLFNLKGQLLSDSIHSVGELHYTTGIKDQYLFEATGNGITGVFLYDAKTQKIVKWVIRDKWYYTMISCGQEKNVAVLFVENGRRMEYYHFHLDPKTLKADLREISWDEYERIMGLNKLKRRASWDWDYENKRDSVLTLEYSVIATTCSPAVNQRLYNPFPVKKKMISDTIDLHIDCDSLVIKQFRNYNGIGYTANKTNHVGYDTLLRYSNYALFRSGDKWGAIACTTVLKAQYDELILVQSTGKELCFIAAQTLAGKQQWGIVTLSGKILTPFEYDRLKAAGTSVISLKAGRYGILDITGKVIAEPQYDKVISHYQRPHWLVIQDQGKRGIYNGRELTAPIFDFPFENVFLVNIGEFELYKISDENNDAIGYMSKSGVRFFTGTP